MTFKENKIIIGLSGKRGVGKTAAADWLVETSGFKKISFAGKLRELAMQFFPFTNNQLSGYEKDSKYNKFDWTPRQFLITLGDMVRFHDKDYFAREALNKINYGIYNRIVFDDTRYLNEVASIKSNGGYIVRINRYEKDNPYKDKIDHVSETELDSYKFDYIIQEYDNVTLSNLHKSIYDIVDRIRKIES